MGIRVEPTWLKGHNYIGHNYMGIRMGPAWLKAAEHRVAPRRRFRWPTPRDPSYIVMAYPSRSVLYSYGPPLAIRPI